jgi:hypothetical protein
LTSFPGILKWKNFLEFYKKLKATFTLKFCFILFILPFSVLFDCSSMTSASESESSTPAKKSRQIAIRQRPLRAQSFEVGNCFKDRIFIG